MTAKISATIRAILKQRDFNSPLYLSDLYDALVPGIVGIDYVNISLSDQDDRSPSVIDADGNMVTAPQQVIILGTLNIQNLDEVI